MYVCESCIGKYKLQFDILSMCVCPCEVCGYITGDWKSRHHCAWVSFLSRWLLWTEGHSVADQIQDWYLLKLLPTME